MKKSANALFFIPGIISIILSIALRIEINSCYSEYSSLSINTAVTYYGFVTTVHGISALLFVIGMSLITFAIVKAISKESNE